MCYDQSDGGRLLRKFASVNLAPWHNFKHGVELIWKQFAQAVFAPLYHCLYPQNKFAIKYQSPQEPLLHMMLLCHGYPEFKANLQAGIIQPGAKRENVVMLRDIEFLCEFAIPVVQSHVVW
jgi:hypothetical protein